MSAAPPRRIRRAARIVVLDPDTRVLLFRYVVSGFPPFWILPGGACEADESFADAARRELLEETGIDASPRRLGIERHAEYVYMGEPVAAVEHFFHLRTTVTRIDTAGHTELEREVMQEHCWLTRLDIARWPETIYPQDLAAMIDLAMAEQETGRDDPR